MYQQAVNSVLEIFGHERHDILARMESNRCAVIRLGTMPYEQAWQLQDRLAEEIAVGKRPATLLVLEHPHTYTFGRRGKVENLLWDEQERRERGIQVHWVDRGGDVTYHGPGQLVGYPLLPLMPLHRNREGEPTQSYIPQADYVGYVRKLESTLILALMRLGIASGQVKGLTGVWVQPHVLSRCLNCRPEWRKHPAKIASIGVKVDVKGISRHGFALNVNPDMSYWEGIVGCGLKETQVVSLADLLDLPPSMEQVIEVVTEAFGQVMGYSMTEETIQLEDNVE